MPKRPAEARLRAAVAAGDPPASAEYASDAKWHRAQDEWLARWSDRALPEGAGRRRQWCKRREEHARLVAAAAKLGSRAPSQQPCASEDARPRLKRPRRQHYDTATEYAFALRMHQLAKAAKRKEPRRTKAQDASRKRAHRAAYRPGERAIRMDVEVAVGRKHPPGLSAEDVARLAARRADTDSDRSHSDDLG